jgi:uncharacterized protein involved in exopolysaccharide biosynthesis
MAQFDGSWDDVASASADGDARQQTGWSGRPRLGWADLVLQLWRAKWTMIIVFIIILALAIVFALTLPKKFEAQSRLFVSLGQEYVFQPLVGDAARGALPELDQVMQGEIALLTSPVIAERVMSRFGLEKLYPEAYADYQEAPEEDKYVILEDAIQAMMKDFSASTSPKNPIIFASFSHKDPQIAADVLNAAIGQYLIYRREVLEKGGLTAFTEQRENFQERLLEQDKRVQSFLRTNQIGDFEAERKAVSDQFARVTDELLSVEAQQREAQSSLAILLSRLQRTPETIDLFTESDAAKQLVDLKVEREKLLSRYTQDSRPVQDINNQIRQVEAFLANPNLQSGTKRRGPNPVHQDLQGQVATQEALAISLGQRSEALRQQRQDLADRQQVLNQLEPQYRELVRDRTILEASVQSFATREEEERALADLSNKNIDNISVETARVPSRGSSLRLPVAILGVLMGGFTALMIGLIMALGRRGFSTAGSAARTLGLPALGSVSLRR